MEIAESKFDDVLIITFSGSIDALTVPKIGEHLNKNISEGDIKLIIDFKEVDYISSAGLRVLLGAIKETRSRNGDLRLANIRPEVKKVLNMSGFSNILKIFPDLESALNSYKN